MVTGIIPTVEILKVFSIFEVVVCLDLRMPKKFMTYGLVLRQGTLLLFSIGACYDLQWNPKDECAGDSEVIEYSADSLSKTCRVQRRSGVTLDLEGPNMRLG